MLVYDLTPEEYLISKLHFEGMKWEILSDIPLVMKATVAGGIIKIIKEREAWHINDEGKEVSLWMTRYYAAGDETQIFWHSKNGDEIGDLEIKHLNVNLIKKIGEIEWNTIKLNMLEK